MDVEVEILEKMLGQDGEVLAELCGVGHGRWEEDEGKEGGVGCGVGGKGREERRAGVVGWGGEDVVCGADGEVAGSGGEKIVCCLGGGGVWGDEPELGFEVR